MRIFAAALMVGSPVAAQIPASPASTVVAAPVDPTRLAIATRLTGQLLPSGSFRKVMTGTIDGITASMTGRMMDMSIRDLAGLGGIDAEKLKSMGPGTVREVMAIIDPAFGQRQQISTKVIVDGMIDIMTTMEPTMREGMAEAYARRFTVDQLKDLERFFASPTGSIYAAQVMEIGTDPAIMTRMQSIMPKLMGAMPGLMKKVQAATAGLPQPRKVEELTAAEKQKIDTMLGTDSKEAK